MSTLLNSKRLGLLLLVGALLAFGVYASAAPLLAPPQTGMLCQTGVGLSPSFDLETTTGYMSEPDGNSLLMWSYVLDNSAAGAVFQTPGPVLCVTQGATVTINLRNNLAENTSLVFPGQSNVTTSGGVAGLLTQEAASGGGTVSYTFTASEPGTYLYESGSEPDKQVQMGLYGALIVRPSLGANYAYNAAGSEFNPNQEYLLVLHALDPLLHEAVEDGAPYDPTGYHPRYWTINGRAFPDTIAPNNAPWLVGQPYGALVQVEAQDPSAPGLPALIRYANASQDNHPFHPHGNHLRVIARDGRLLLTPGGADASMEAFTKTIGSGQTYDLLFRWLDLEGFASSGPTLPADVLPIPGLQNLVFKDDFTWYSGSPYLGESGDFPSGVTVNNQCGEFYYPWHSHALNEFQNFDEGFGGLATLLRVDPPGGCP
jgi:FtsP/CotA-like multicopper oxidase with cupredoxin domain